MGTNLKGEKQIKLIIGIIVATLIFNFYLTTSTNTFDGKMIFQGMLYAYICYQFYTRKIWAKNLIIALISFTLCLRLPELIQNFHILSLLKPIIAFLYCAQIVGCIIILILLLTSKQLKECFNKKISNEDLNL